MGLAMIVCICNNVNSATIEASVQNGACSVDSVRAETGATSCCGKCQFKVNAIVQDTLATLPTPQLAKQG